MTSTRVKGCMRIYTCMYMCVRVRETITLAWRAPFDMVDTYYTMTSRSIDLVHCADAVHLLFEYFGADFIYHLPRTWDTAISSSSSPNATYKNRCKIIYKNVHTHTQSFSLWLLWIVTNERKLRTFQKLLSIFFLTRTGVDINSFFLYYRNKNDFFRSMWRLCYG